MDKKVKVEFEYSDMNENDIIKVEDKFFRIVIQELDSGRGNKTKRIFLRRVNSLEDLEEI